MNSETMKRAVNYATWLSEHTETIESLARIGYLQNAVSWMKNHGVATLLIQITPEEIYSVKGFTLDAEIHTLEDPSIVNALVENHPDFNKETSGTLFSMAATGDQINSWLEQSMRDTEKQKVLMENAARFIDALTEIQRDSKGK